MKTFDTLLTDCSPTHPNITLRAPGDPPLTIDQLRTNYDEIANCGYQEYGAKPYWVPEYVSDIDICAQKLGPAWHLPSEADILGLTDADFQMFSDTMTALQVYVRAADGSLSLGDLGPASTHVSTLPVPNATDPSRSTSRRTRRWRARSGRDAGTRAGAEGSPHISPGSGADPRRNGSRYDQVLVTIEGLGARFTQRDGGDEMTQAGESST